MKKQIVLTGLIAMLLIGCGGMEADAPNEDPQASVNDANNAAEANDSAALIPPRDDAAHRLENPSGAAAPRSTPFDLRYIDMMIAHHQQGLGMARIAAVEAASDEIREMAQDMIDIHETEIEQLQAWRAEWYPDAEAASTQYTQGSIVAAQGESFDRAFLKAMVAHHASAYHLSREALRRSDQADLREFAQHIMDTQADQMDRMQQMLVDTE